MIEDLFSTIEADDASNSADDVAEEQIIQPKSGDNGAFGFGPDEPSESQVESAQSQGKLSPDQAYQLIQSQKDKAEARARALEEEAMLFAPVRRLLEERPELLEELAAKVSPQAQQGMKKPSVPQRPANYSRVEAMENPESDSAKYLDAMEQYQYDKAVYDEYSENQRVEQERKKMQMEAERMAMIKQQNEVAGELVAKFGYTKDQIQDFFQKVGATPTLDDLVAFHRYLGRKGTPATQQVPKKADSQQYPPGFVGGNESGKPVDIADSFVNGFNRNDKSWIFGTK